MTPRDPQYHARIADCYQYLKNHNEAIICYDRALNINSKSDKWHHNKGLSLVSLGRYEEALVEFDKAIAINKKSDLFHFTRADCLIYLERYYEALERCDRSLSIKRKDNDKA